MIKIINICKSKFKNQNGKEENVMKNSKLKHLKNLHDKMVRFTLDTLEGHKYPSYEPDIYEWFCELCDEAQAIYEQLGGKKAMRETIRFFSPYLEDKERSLT